MAKSIQQDIDLGLIKTDDFDKRVYKGVLQIWTYPHEGVIVSACTVFWVGNGGRQTELYGDFDKTLLRTRQRGTQKAIATQHAAVFTTEKIAELVSQAKERSEGREGVTAAAA